MSTDIDKEIDEMLTRQNGLHGIQHQVMGGKNLAFDYCVNCKESKTATKALIRKHQIAKLTVFVDHNEQVVNAEHIRNEIATLQSQYETLMGKT